MAVTCYLATIFCLLVTWFSGSESCGVEDVAVYKMILKTMWTEDKFPKDYPKHWPKAQWSQVFGQSHNASYHLYEIGETPRETIRKFSQFGQIDKLVEEGEEEPLVYDQFSAPAIEKGNGKTENIVFVDGAHTMVSVVCRIVPSPDWFIGVDGLNLCIDSSWVEQITLDLYPLDAGAASGLTFTAPRWETSPPGKVSQHGPKSPNHPAAGFYYPDLKVLPVIASVEFVKIKEYSTVEMNQLARKELILKMKLKDMHKGRPKSLNTDKVNEDYKDDAVTENHSDTLKDLEEDSVVTSKPNNPDDHVEIITQSPILSSTSEPEFGTKLQSMDDVVLAVARGKKLGLGKHLPRHFRSRLHHAVNRLTPNDCKVSEWSDWSPCSTTCGFGDKFRTRKVIREPKDNGRECPILTDRAHCGNANSCDDMDYFDW